MNHTNEGRFIEAEEYTLATIAFVVADAIEKSGLTQREVAKRLGVSEARVSQILSADNNLTIKTLAKLADVLNKRVFIRFIQLDNADCRPDGPQDFNENVAAWSIAA